MLIALPNYSKTTPISIAYSRYYKKLPNTALYPNG